MLSTLAVVSPWIFKGLYATLLTVHIKNAWQKGKMERRSIANGDRKIV